jgi:LPS sulfotransferase NodH
MSPALRRLILCRAVSHVVSRRQQEVNLGVMRILRISYAAPPVSDPVFIICEARTGSTLLGDYLNSHPMVACEFEILNQGMIPHLRIVSLERDLHFYLDTLFRAIQGKIKCGKLHFPHFNDFGITVDHLLEWFPRARFIILYRGSLLEQFVSLKLAEATGRWIATRPEEETDREVAIDVAELLAFALATKNQYEQLANHPPLRGRHLTISYEELASDASRTFETKIWPFLGILPFPLKTVLRKQNRRSVRESVSNFHEVESLLSSGVLEQQLDSAIKFK